MPKEWTESEILAVLFGASPQPPHGSSCFCGTHHEVITEVIEMIRAKNTSPKDNVNCPLWLIQMGIAFQQIGAVYGVISSGGVFDNASADEHKRTESFLFGEMVGALRGRHEDMLKLGHELLVMHDKAVDTPKRG